MFSRALKSFVVVSILALAPLASAQDAPTDVQPAYPTSEPPIAAPPEPAPAPSETPPPPVVREVPPTPAPPPAPVAHEDHERHHNRIFAPGYISLTTGAGAANYFGASDRGDTVDTGAAWDARVTFGTRSPIALEAAYMGGVNNIDLGNGAHGQLHSNGVDGDLRLQLPTRVQPYVFGGVGYNHMEVHNNGTGAAGIYVGHDDQVTVPAGLGLTTYVGRHFNVDARGTYRFIPDNGITEMGTGHLHQWMAQAHVGYVF